MKNVYMVQASTTYGGDLFKSAYLPYAAGLLTAYAFSYELIKENYEFKRFVFTKENTDGVVDSLEAPAVIGFSNYIWNTEYNKTLAEKIKCRYPGCITVFGGHNVPPGERFLKDYSYIDFLIHGEGEEAFRDILTELLSDTPDFGKINNISFRRGEEYVTTPEVVLTKTDYPSPYLSGTFDSILENNRDMQLDAILETSRGCPRNCAYCDWGCTNSRIKLFPLERVLAEIEWFGKNKIAFLWGADANFGEFERDEQIAQCLIDTRKKYGYPERIRTNYAKDKYERVFKISRTFEQLGMSKEGATLSFQSMNPDTLKAIGRKNMSIEKFRELMQMYKEAGVTTYSELILGLPCETYDSFCEGIGKLLEAGQHRLINVYNCEILPNSPMARDEYREKYGIKTANVVFLTAHSKANPEIVERTNYVISTNTMSVEEWIAANVFACFEIAFHHYGILKCFAIYSFYEKQIPYEKFYNCVVDYAKKSDLHVLNNSYRFLHNLYETASKELPTHLYTNEIYGKITWTPEHIALLDVIYRLDEYYNAIRPMLKNLGLSDDIIGELIDYQKCILKRPGATELSCDFEYDWHSYFNSTVAGCYTPLEKKPNRMIIDNSDVPRTWPEYGVKATWFGKNGNTFNKGITCQYL